MRELVGGKNTIGQTAAVLKKPHKATFNLFSAATNCNESFRADSPISSIVTLLIETQSVSEILADLNNLTSLSAREYFMVCEIYFWLNGLAAKGCKSNEDI